MKTRYDLLVLLIGIGDAVTNPDGPDDVEPLYDALRGAALDFVRPLEGASDPLFRPIAAAAVPGDQPSREPLPFPPASAPTAPTKPRVTGIIPHFAMMGSGDLRLTIDGEDFADDAQVYRHDFSDRLEVLERSANRLVVSVPADVLDEAGPVPISVLNPSSAPDIEDGMAEQVDLAVIDPNPAPAPIDQGDGAAE